MNAEGAADAIVNDLFKPPSGEGNFLWVVRNEPDGATGMGGWSPDDVRAIVLKHITNNNDTQKTDRYAH